MALARFIADRSLEAGRLVADTVMEQVNASLESVVNKRPLQPLDTQRIDELGRHDIDSNQIATLTALTLHEMVLAVFSQIGSKQ